MGLLDRILGRESTPTLKDSADTMYELQRNAIAAAKSQAQSENRRPTLADYLNAARTLDPNVKEESLADFRQKLRLNGSPSKTPALTLDGFDINEADYPYDGFKNQLNFEGAHIHNCRLKPACVYDVTTGAHLENVTLDGMGEGQTLVLKGTQNKNLTFENIKGGTIQIDPRAQVHGMHLNRQTASLDIKDGAVVNDLKIDGATIVKLDAGEGAKIVRPKFLNTTISQTGSVSGSVWTGGNDPDGAEFDGVSLAHTDFSGATLTNIRLKNMGQPQLKGWNLAGAKITNLSINGKLVTSPDQLKKLGITVDDKTSIQATPDAKARDIARSAGLGVELNRAVQSVLLGGGPSIEAPVIEAPKAQVHTAALGGANPQPETYKGKNIWNFDDTFTAPATIAVASIGANNSNEIVAPRDLPTTQKALADREAANKKFAESRLPTGPRKA